MNSLALEFVVDAAVQDQLFNLTDAACDGWLWYYLFLYNIRFFCYSSIAFLKIVKCSISGNRPIEFLREVERDFYIVLRRSFFLSYDSKIAPSQLSSVCIGDLMNYLQLQVLILILFNIMKGVHT